MLQEASLAWQKRKAEAIRKSNTANWLGRFGQRPSQGTPNQAEASPRERLRYENSMAAAQAARRCVHAAAGYEGVGGLGVVGGLVSVLRAHIDLSGLAGSACIQDRPGPGPAAAGGDETRSGQGKGLRGAGSYHPA